MTQELANEHKGTFCYRCLRVGQDGLLRLERSWTRDH